MKRKIALAAALAMGSLSLFTTGAGTASAANSTGTTTEPSPATPACVIKLETGEQACAATTEQASRAVGAQANLRVLRIWQLPHFDTEGYSFTFSAARPCSPEFEREWQVWDLGEIEQKGPGTWNNSISSLETDIDPEANCSVKMHQLTGHGGTSKWIHHFHVDLRQIPHPGPGTWDNRASSLIIT